MGLLKIPLASGVLIHFPEYVCPKCGYFNPSARSKGSRRQRTPSPHVDVDTDPNQSPKATPMDGVESTVPTVDMAPEMKEQSRFREMTDRTRDAAVHAEGPTS